MKSFGRVALCLFALVALAGCASTKVTGSRNYQGERLARPDRIIVHDFAATRPTSLPGPLRRAGMLHRARHKQPRRSRLAAIWALK